MKRKIKLLYLFLFLAGINFSAKADPTFLTSVPFAEAYKDVEIIENTIESGISQDDFLEYLFSSDIEFGKKVALINALSVYYDAKVPEDEMDSFKEYTSAFTDRLLYFYDVKSIESPNVSAEFQLFYYLLNDYQNYSPEIENYKKIVAKMPNSLTAQTLLLFTKAYNLLFIEEGRQEFKKNTYAFFKTKYKSYKQDARLQAVNDVFEWIDTII